MQEKHALIKATFLDVNAKDSEKTTSILDLLKESEIDNYFNFCT